MIYVVAEIRLYHKRKIKEANFHSSGGLGVRHWRSNQTVSGSRTQ
jgi:hypothetical protein